jgi:hypothetical protein
MAHNRKKKLKGKKQKSQNKLKKLLKHNLDIFKKLKNENL